MFTYCFELTGTDPIPLVISVLGRRERVGERGGGMNGLGWGGGGGGRSQSGLHGPAVSRRPA